MYIYSVIAVRNEQILIYTYIHMYICIKICSFLKAITLYIHLVYNKDKNIYVYISKHVATFSVIICMHTYIFNQIQNFAIHTCAQNKLTIQLTYIFYSIS